MNKNNIESVGSHHRQSKNSRARAGQRLRGRARRMKAETAGPFIAMCLLTEKEAWKV